MQGEELKERRNYFRKFVAGYEVLKNPKTENLQVFPKGSKIPEEKVFEGSPYPTLKDVVKAYDTGVKQHMFDINRNLLNWLLDNQDTVATDCESPEQLKEFLDSELDSLRDTSSGLLEALLENALDEVDTGDIAESYFEYLEHNFIE